MREIIINERQEQLLMNTILQESVYNQDYNAKILRIKDILDKGFKKGTIQPQKNEKGNPYEQEVVVMMCNGKPVQTMTDKQLFYHLQHQDEIRNMLPAQERDELLKKVIVAWYNKKINNRGSILP